MYKEDSLCGLCPQRQKLFINLEKKHINKYNIKHKEQN